MQSTSIEISYLHDHPEYVSLLAQWYLSAWGSYNPAHTIESCTKRIQESLNKGKLPIGYIAFNQKQPVGMATLLETNGLKSELSPWLGSVLVESSNRRQGIATKIVKFAVTQAKQLGFKVLYLWTYADGTLPGWYQSMGWKFVGIDVSPAGHPVKIMKIST